MDIWDILNSINHTKVDLTKEEGFEKAYNPYLTNRGLSLFLDTIEKANEMNMLHQLEPRLQYDYLLNKIRPRKRFSKWFKKEKDDELKLVMEYYDYNVSKAKTALQILTHENLKEIKELIDSKS